MNTSPLACTKCRRTTQVATAIAHCWLHDAGMPYICPVCLTPRIDAAVLAAQQNKDAAIRNVYQTLKQFARL